MAVKEILVLSQVLEEILEHDLRVAYAQRPQFRMVLCLVMVAKRRRERI